MPHPSLLASVQTQASLPDSIHAQQSTGTAALRGCFVTGTDTEIGKTRVSAALLHWLGQQGVRAVGFKPVASGMDCVSGNWVNDDVQTLLAASASGFGTADVGPLQLRTACAPHLAARLEGRSIERAELLAAAQRLAQRADFVVAEGAGGVIVPLGPDWDSADLMRALGLPLLLVVGLRLGCINHALLSAEALRARGLRLLGWVGNTLVPAMDYQADNLATLRHEFERRHQVPCLGVLPRLSQPNPAEFAAHLDPALLAERLLPAQPGLGSQAP